MSEAVSRPPVNIYVESNPNPNSLKFVANFMLLPEGTHFDYPDMASAKNSQLAQELFTFPFVTRVFIMSNFVTVTKDDATNWEDVKLGIKDHITNYLEAEKKAVDLDQQVVDTPPAEATGENAHIEATIMGILDEYIKPAVEQDGGAISFHSFENGLVKVVLQGSCSGCPSSTLTLKAGIENLLKRMVPEVQEVEAING